MNKLILEINGASGAGDDKKSLAIPSRRRKRLGRRRLNGASIEFYDLAQVSEDGLTFADHPVLKTPNYTTSFEVASPGDQDGVLEYAIDQFTTADYQAYTDRFFEIPVGEWKDKYKRLGYVDYDGSDYYKTPYPSFLSLANKGGTQAAIMRAQAQHTPSATTARVMIDAGSHTDPDSYALEMLNGAGLSWWTGDKARAKGITYLESNGTASSTIYTATDVASSFFPFSTEDKVSYKVTTENDPDAPEAGVIAPSGVTRIFLMPHITAWAASAVNPSDRVTRYTLGPVYQITPRKMWPRYEDTDWSHSSGTYSVGAFSYSGVTDDPDGRKSDFFAYQMNRSGMQASTWTRASSLGLFTDSTFTGSLAPGDWPNGDNYVSQAFCSLTSVDMFDTAGTYNSSTGSGTNPYRGDITFSPAGGATQFFDMTDPFLCAVIQKGSSFYYVWMLPGAIPASDWSDFQGAKYRLTLRHTKLNSDILIDDTEFYLP